MSPVAAPAPTSQIESIKTKVTGALTTLSAPLTSESTASPRAEELTYDAFKPFGRVVQGWDGKKRSPAGVHVTEANQGTAFKFHRLAELPQGASITHERRSAQADARSGASVRVTSFDRSSATKVYLPQGRGVAPGLTALPAGASYLVVVAQGETPSQPKAFLATSAQGVSFEPNTWHAIVALNEDIDFAIVYAAETSSTPADVSIDVPAHKPAAVPELPPSSAPGLVQKVQGLLEGGLKVLNPVLITEENWAPYGELIGPAASKPARLTNTYPADQTGARTAIGVFRATPKEGVNRGQLCDVRFLERHIYTSQAFVPLGKDNLSGVGEAPLSPGGTFLVVVADNGPDDRPDPATLKAFIMESGSGLNYRAGVWHHPVLVLDGPLDLACIETQVSTGEFGKTYAPDCELIEYEQAIGKVNVPAL
jgi:allantoicase